MSPLLITGWLSIVGFFGAEGTEMKEIREYTEVTFDIRDPVAETKAEVIKALRKRDIIATINQTIDADTAELVVEEFGHKATRVSAADVELGISGGPDKEDKKKERQEESLVVKGRVKWLDPVKGYGFATAADGGRDVFIHISVVERAGLINLNTDQLIEMAVEEEPKGRAARSCKIIAPDDLSPSEAAMLGWGVEETYEEVDGAKSTGKASHAKPEEAVEGGKRRPTRTEQRNFGAVSEGIFALTEVLQEFVYGVLKRSKKDDWWTIAVYPHLPKEDQARTPEVGTHKDLIYSLDLYACLVVMNRAWNMGFDEKLSEKYRAYVRKAQGSRSTWGHFKRYGFSTPLSYRKIDTMVRLASPIDKEVEKELQHLRIRIHEHWRAEIENDN